MEGKGGKNIRLKWFLLLTLLSQNMAIPIMCSSQGVESQKNYYPHPPHTPRKSPRSHHGSPVCGNPPSHGGGGGHVDPSTPPGGGGGSYTPPSGGGGGSYTPPSGGGGGSYTPPSGGGGGSYNAPPSGGHGGYYPSPPSDGYGTPAPPAGIITPATPFTPTPNLPDPSSPPFITDPSSPPFLTDPSSPPFIPDPTPYIIGTCNYWRTHPALIWALFGVGRSMGSAFGVTTTPAFSSGVSLLQALANTRMDGYGELYREGTASLLNSMASTNFAFTTEQVRVRFATALVSNSAASAQAQLFKQANQRKLKLRA